jgi:hypothetical protein
MGRNKQKRSPLYGTHQFIVPGGKWKNEKKREFPQNHCSFQKKSGKTFKLDVKGPLLGPPKVVPTGQKFEPRMKHTLQP